jgi:hypothetical protein
MTVYRKPECKRGIKEGRRCEEPEDGSNRFGIGMGCPGGDNNSDRACKETRDLYKGTIKNETGALGRRKGCNVGRAN